MLTVSNLSSGKITKSGILFLSISFILFHFNTKKLFILCLSYIFFKSLAACFAEKSKIVPIFSCAENSNHSFIS